MDEMEQLKITKSNSLLQLNKYFGVSSDEKLKTKSNNSQEESSIKQNGMNGSSNSSPSASSSSSSGVSSNASSNSSSLISTESGKVIKNTSTNASCPSSSNPSSKTHPNVHHNHNPILAHPNMTRRCSSGSLDSALSFSQTRDA